MARLLFITSNRIGDAVLSTAALEAALARVPGAGVTVACGPLPATLFRATPGLERIVTFAKEEGRWVKLWGQLRDRRYDLAVDLRGSLTTLALSARRRIIHKKSRIIRHKLEELAETMRARGRIAPRLHLDARAQMEAGRVAGEGKPILALGAGANFIGKRWAPERFATLAQRLAGAGGALGGARVVLLGAPQDRAICAEVAGALRSAGVEAVDAAGALDLLACAALLAKASLFVGNDSGLMHIAAAVGAPTLGLFGPSDERVYGPRGARARSLRGRDYDAIMATGYMPLIEHSLMDDVTVEAAHAASLELLAPERAP